MQQPEGQTGNGGHIFPMGAGHHWPPTGDGPAHTDHVGRQRACSDNSINMISVFTLINIFKFYH